MTTHDPHPPPPRQPSDEGDAGKAEQVREAAQEEGLQLKDTAAQEARSVVDTAQDQVGRVADEAAHQARDLLSSTTANLEDQAEQQTHKLAEVIRGAGDQARALAEGRTDEAGEADRYVGQIAGTLTDIADRIDRLGARGSMEELQRFARRRPGAFLAGAAAAGLLTSRIVRNAGNGSGSSGRDVASEESARQIPPVTTPSSQGFAEPSTRPAVPPAAPPASPSAADQTVTLPEPGLQNTGGPTHPPGMDRGPGVH